VVALYLGFYIEKIEVSQGLPRVICALDSVQETHDERYIFLAGGIASEKLLYGDYDREASRRDQSMSTERGGGTIDTYLPQALNILRLNENCLLRFRERLTLAWVQEAAASAFEADTDSFELLPRAEIEHIWKTCQNNR
jgi:hypothetical protein